MSPWLLCWLLSLGCAAGVAKCSIWIKSLTRYIAEETNARQIVLVSNFPPNESFKSSIIDELFREVRKFPIVRINLGAYEDPKKTSDTSETFFIVIDEFERASEKRSRKLIDHLAQISDLKLQSKYLIVRISPFSEIFEDLLRYAWSKKLLDFTIIELVKIRKGRKFLGFDSLAPPIVHQWNPFKNEYRAQSCSSMIEWFPDKISNMWGHPLKVGLVNGEPFSRIIFDDEFMPIVVEGAHTDVWKMIASKLNFSMNYLPRLDKYFGARIAASPFAMYDYLEIGNIDLIAFLIPHFTESLKHNTMRTAPILLDELCPIVPVLPARAEEPDGFHLNSIKTYLCGFVLVMIFRLLGLALRFDKDIWQVFNIVGVIFGKSITRLPIRNSERILCASLLIASAIYSSEIYESLTDMSLQSSEADVEFETFDDLDKSGLVPIINTYLFEKTFLHPDESMKKIRDKCVHKWVNECPEIAAIFKNVTCLRRRDEANCAIKNIERRGIGKIKMAKCCFWWDSTAFPLPKGSPYRSHFDILIGRMHSAGLISKIYDIPSMELSSVQRTTNFILLRRLLAIAIVGYALSALIFVAEIILYKIHPEKFETSE